MTNMSDDFYIKFAGINYPKDKEPENEFFIGRVGICYEYDPMYDQINKFLDEYPNLRKDYPAVFDILYGVIGWKQHRPFLNFEISSVKGYVKNISLDKLYKIEMSGIQFQKGKRKNDGTKYPDTKCIEIKKIYEVTNVKPTPENMNELDVSKLELKDITLSKEKIEKLKEEHEQTVSKSTR